MSEARFTPGPWFLRDARLGDGVEVTAATRVGRFDIAYVDHAQQFDKPDADEVEQRANAHLIAAAPDLYACLHNAVEDPTVIDTVAWEKQVLAALAKAEGRS